MKILSKVKYQIAPGFGGLESWIQHLPESFPVTGISIFKDRNEVKVFEEQGYMLNVKGFRIPNLVNRFAYVYLRGSKASRSFANALKFLDSGAATPRPVAYIECLTNGRLAESFYVSINYPNDFTLRDVLSDVVPDKMNILRQWVHFTWNSLHRKGIFHLDYSPGNTLVRKVGNSYEFVVVDLNRMKFIPVDFQKGIMNFRQLDADEESLRLIASEYAALWGEPAGEAIELLLDYDRKNKVFRQRKGEFKQKTRFLRKSGGKEV